MSNIAALVDRVAAQSGPPQGGMQTMDQVAAQPNLFSPSMIGRVAFCGAVVWLGSKGAEYLYEQVFGKPAKTNARPSRRRPTKSKKREELDLTDEDGPDDEEE